MIPWKKHENSFIFAYSSVLHWTEPLKANLGSIIGPNNCPTYTSGRAYSNKMFPSSYWLTNILFLKRKMIFHENIGSKTLEKLHMHIDIVQFFHTYVYIKLKNGK